MIDPVTAFTTAVAAFNTVKKLVAAGKEVESVVSQLGKWYTAIADHGAASAAKKKPPLFRKLLHAGSVEQEALEIIVHQQKLRDMEKELRELITYAYGADVYANMIAMRRKIREEREREAKEHARRRKEAAEATFWWTIAGTLAAVAIYFGWVFVDFVKRGRV